MRDSALVMELKFLDSLSLSPRLFGGALAIYVMARLSLAALSYQGDDSPEARQRALRHFSESQINAGIEYSRAGFTASVAFLLLSLAILVWLAAGGGSAKLAAACLRWTGGREWLQTPLYLTIFLVGAGLVSLPFDFYHGFVIERRFGFSNLTAGGWLAHHAKSAAVGGVLAVAIGSGAYALLRRFPNAWVWALPVAALLLQVGLIYLYPRAILPLFYKIEPLSDPALKQTISGVAEKAGVHLGSIYVINESRYSSHTNAFFTGFGDFKEIYLYDTLIKDHAPEEIAATLAHELGHWKGNHVLKGLLLYEFGILAACLAVYFLFPVVARAEFLRVPRLGDVAGYPLLLLVASVVAFFTSPIESGVSRRFEREADAYGLALSGSGEIYIRDFKRLAERNRSNLLPHPLAVFWRYSHPPVLERIEAVERAQAGAPGALRSRQAGME